MHQHPYSIFLNGNSISIENAKEQLEQKEATLAFHGFGQHAGVFKRISAQEKNTVFFCFDLFFHGKSKEIKFSEAYDIEIFVNEIDFFLQYHSIQRFNLLAFSIGARPCLAIAQNFNNRIDNLQLIAPDGIYENPWYHFATRIALGRLSFKVLARNEDLLRASIERSLVMTNGRLKLFKLALKVLNEHSTTKVYHTWLTYSNFRFDAKKIIRQLQAKDAQVKVVLSNNDHVIKAGKVRKKLNACGEIFITVNYEHEKILQKLVKIGFFEKDKATS